ncbi:GtrA family protein [uncultured Sulfitobacter sp.]|uniref:GtrA family protein n=1 Tax=uncultured Sulfitobacter sp. TaxID=191468 RepID=UPI0026154716|nr:GtrA family protein [uncultured Sulfitobacter sp.]
MALIPGEALRFGVVGVAATGVHLAALTAGVELAGIPPGIMNGLAFCAAVSVTYFGQALWVFRVARRHTLQTLRFAISVLFGILANMAIMAAAVHLFDLPYMFGFAAGLILVPAATFVLNKFWVFTE